MSHFLTTRYHPVSRFKNNSKSLMGEKMNEDESFYRQKSIGTALAYPPDEKIIWRDCFSLRTNLFVSRDLISSAILRTNYFSVIIDFGRDIFKRKNLFEDVEDDSQTISRLPEVFFCFHDKKPFFLRSLWIMVTKVND
jgi:hypothetical protein